jgi:hypothetical protein
METQRLFQDWALGSEGAGGLVKEWVGGGIVGPEHLVVSLEFEMVVMEGVKVGVT